MAITEPSRHQLYQRLEVVLGSEEATTLMEHLPPDGWASVATKDDLARLDDRFGARLAHLDARFTMIDARFVEVDARFVEVDARFAQVYERFDRLEQVMDARFAAADANVRSYVDRAIRTNMIVTIGVLGTLTSAVTVLTNL